MKYDVWIKGWWHKRVGIVEADSLEDAENKAGEMDGIETPMICYQCGKDVELNDVESVDLELIQ